SCEWQRALSGGEQQRISLARALLFRPETLYLDEATNQLDDDSARGLLKMLKRELPGCTVVAVTHQAVLAGLFERTLMLEGEAVPA
ncbi:MAG TPA: ABC transporter ATP-binding protein, partial [Pseudomonas sp.]|nr:ABC transporter ATP-binding protein [Pseudomonas sp.]